LPGHAVKEGADAEGLGDFRELNHRDKLSSYQSLMAHCWT
jgi:hypothetical protein